MRGRLYETVEEQEHAAAKQSEMSGVFLYREEERILREKMGFRRTRNLYLGCLMMEIPLVYSYLDVVVMISRRDKAFVHCASSL